MLKYRELSLYYGAPQCLLINKIPWSKFKMVLLLIQHQLSFNNAAIYPFKLLMTFLQILKHYAALCNAATYNCQYTAEQNVIVAVRHLSLAMCLTLTYFIHHVLYFYQSPYIHVRVWFLSLCQFPTYYII